METGDVLTAVDEKDVTGMDLSDVVDLVKGEEGSKVKITVQRGGDSIEMEMTRKIVKTQTVEIKMKDEDVGYLKISEFDEVTLEQFREGWRSWNIKDERPCSGLTGQSGWKSGHGL